MIKCVFWVRAVKSGRGRTERNMATTCPCRHPPQRVKSHTNPYVLIHLTKRSLADGALKAPSERSQRAFSCRTGGCRLLLSAPITPPSAPRCSSNAQTERGFSLAAALLPCCFIHRAQGSFAKSSVVDLRRQTALQIHQNSVKLNDILLCRLANRKENGGGSALKPRVFRQISCSVSRRDPLKCLLSSRGAPEEMLPFHTHMHAFTYKHTP